jgi:hypothetical protein
MPGYLRGELQEDHSSWPAPVKKLIRTPYSTNKLDMVIHIYNSSHRGGR